MKHLSTFYICLLLLFTPVFVFAQHAVSHQNQIWFGYMTSTKINKNHSFWNDVHWVPDGFFIIRTGITKSFKKVNLTVGYAYAKLPESVNNASLNRTEHRPWLQVQTSIPLSKKLLLIPRFRYDARFRQNIANGQLEKGYDFSNRIRWMTTLRIFLTNEVTKLGKPFISIGDELLLNFGKNITFNRFDQNRFFLLAGSQFKNIQVQVGYMNRYVNATPNLYVRNNTMVFWVTQQFDWHKKEKKQ